MTNLIYRKAGETIRAELARGDLTILEISEHGTAEEDGELFTCRAERNRLEADRVSRPDFMEVVEKLRSIDFVDRFTVVSGNAAHQVEGGNAWRESFGRIHISLKHRETGIQVELDLGGAILRDLDLPLVSTIASILERPRRDVPRAETVRFLPHVAAALWTAGGPAVQSTHPAFRFDGDGREIRPGGDGRNRYRPSYRARPIPMSFHRIVTPRGANVEADVTAAGIVVPFRAEGSTLTARVLCTRDEDAFVATLAIPREMASSIVFVEDRSRWFPFAAGSYGADTVVTGVTLRS